MQRLEPFDIGTEIKTEIFEDINAYSTLISLEGDVSFGVPSNVYSRGMCTVIYLL